MLAAWLRAFPARRRRRQRQRQRTPGSTVEGRTGLALCVGALAGAQSPVYVVCVWEEQQWPRADAEPRLTACSSRARPMRRRHPIMQSPGGGERALSECEPRQPLALQRAACETALRAGSAASSNRNARCPSALLRTPPHVRGRLQGLRSGGRGLSSEGIAAFVALRMAALPSRRNLRPPCRLRPAPIPHLSAAPVRARAGSAPVCCGCLCVGVFACRALAAARPLIWAAPVCCSLAVCLAAVAYP